MIVALMSPVKEHHESVEGGSYDIVLALDPAALSPALMEQIETFIASGCWGIPSTGSS